MPADFLFSFLFSPPRTAALYLCAGLPIGNTEPKEFPSQVGGNAYFDFVVEDTLVVPTTIPAGDYVLGWRWDAEMTSQIWQSCSDITIA